MLRHFILLLFIASIASAASGIDHRTTLTIGEYNVENMFDAVDDSLTDDDAFTPQGENHWTKSIYYKKLNAIARAIIAMGTYPDTLASSASTITEQTLFTPLDIIGLCEVENDSVMTDLTKRTLLRNANYEYLITHSQDQRGINVALLYNRFAFFPLCHYGIRISMPKGTRPTRDILYVKGTTSNDDTLHIFVCHMPSRRGGERKTRDARIKCVSRLSESIDSIRQSHRSPNIIIMGDFNDYSGSKPLRMLTDTNYLIDISTDAKAFDISEQVEDVRGTYRYQGIWGSLDHIFLSANLATRTTTCSIIAPPMLLEDDKKFGGRQPNRFLLGTITRSGFSDHLPLRAVIDMSRK